MREKIKYTDNGIVEHKCKFISLMYYHQEVHFSNKPSADRLQNWLVWISKSPREWTTIEIHINDQVINDGRQCLTCVYKSFSFSDLVHQMPMGVARVRWHLDAVSRVDIMLGSVGAGKDGLR